MLTIYSTTGSPGASTSAMHLAALWASQGREVLLIEADPVGGSISHNLGIQFTPGTASFVASGQTMQSNHLIAHAQDVLFANLHVMPAPASPTGARGIFQVLSDLSEELRSISENEMAVIIDGGVISPETAASGLTTSAAGVVAVCRNDSPLDGLQHLTDALAAGPGGSEAPAGCAVTVGESSMSAEEWQQSRGLTFSGSIATLPDAASDLTTFLNRTKRKNKKWLASLEQLAEALYPYAQPPLSSRPRRTGTAGADPAPDAQPAAGEHTPAEPGPVADEPAADDTAIAAEAPPAVAEQAQPSPEPVHGHPPAHYLPPTGWHGYPPPSQPYEQGGYPPPSQPYEQGGYPPPSQPYEQGGYPPPSQPYEQGGYPPPSQPYEQGGYPPPSQPYEQGGYPPPSQPYEQGGYPPPSQPYEQGGYPPPSQPYEQGGYPPPSQPYEQGGYPPPSQPYEQGGYPPPSQPYEQGGYPPPSQPYEQGGYPPPSQPYEQPAELRAEETPVQEPPPRPDVKPTGSFRDWAARLHGSKAGGSTVQNTGV